MQAFFKSEGSYALQFMAIFLVIVVLSLIVALLFMRLFGRGLTLSASASQRGRQPRLGIVDIYELDRHRQLILLRRDNVEHLLLVGGPNDVVVERHIQRGAGSRYAPEAGARTGEGGLAEPGGFEPPRTDPFLDSPIPPTFAMPEVVPAALPGAPPVPDRAPPLDPGLFEPEITPADAPPRPASPVSRLMRRATPPVIGPRMEAASELPPRSEPAAAEPDPLPEPPPVMASRGPRSVDPAVLSDMARQLQVALKRPSSAVTPPPGNTGEASETAPPPPAEKPAEPDPVAAAMAASRTAEPSRPVPPAAVVPPPPAPPVSKSEPMPAPVMSPPPAEVKPDPKPAPPRPVAPPQFVAPSRSEPPKPDSAKPDSAKRDSAKSEPPKSEPPKSEPPGSEAYEGERRPDRSRPEPSRPEPPKADAPESGSQGPNPFSVEEIEAEFARLLGRPLDSKN